MMISFANEASVKDRGEARTRFVRRGGGFKMGLFAFSMGCDCNCNTGVRKSACIPDSRAGHSSRQVESGLGKSVDDGKANCRCAERESDASHKYKK